MTAFRFLMWCLLLPLAGCSDPADSGALEGYVEGEFVHVASPLGGRLESLAVSRGDRVEPGMPLFHLESITEGSILKEATARAAAARATLDDLRKGKRPAEITSLKAQLKEAESALAFANNEFARQMQLFKQGVATGREQDAASTSQRREQQQVAKLKADLETAELGARDDQIAAAEAEHAAREAAVERARWDLAQKSPVATQAAPVFDTLFVPGEWVPAGQPVVVLLPPDRVKIRVFVPEPWLAKLQVGDAATVSGHGMEPFPATISYLSPQSEYTPPVLYSRENRVRLVYLVELKVDPSVAIRLHPGQPVDIRFDPQSP